MSDIINDGRVLVFVTPFESYTPYNGGDEGSILEILVDSKLNNYVYTNFHPKNLMYNSSHKLKIIDIGRSLEPYNEKGYGNMIRRAYLSTYYSQRSDLTELISSLSRSVEVRELKGIDKFQEILEAKFQSNIDES